MKSASIAWRNVLHRATAPPPRRSGLALTYVAAGCLFLLTACNTTPTESTPDSSPALDVPVERVNYGNPQVRWDGDVLASVVFGRPVIQPADDSRMMRVTQPVSTTSTTPVILEYRVIFIDAAGNTVAAAEPRSQLLVLSGGTPVFLEGRAGDQLAHDYVIEIKARNMQR